MTKKDEDIILDVEFEVKENKPKKKDPIKLPVQYRPQTKEERDKLPINERIFYYSEIEGTLEYNEHQQPIILDEKGKRIPIKVDKKGGLRHAKKGYLLKGSKAVNYTDVNYTNMKEYARKLLGQNGEKLIDFWMSVMEYDQKKSKDKTARFKSSDQMKAAEMLAQYGQFEKAAERKHTQFDHREVKIIIGGGDKTLRLEDLE